VIHGKAIPKRLKKNKIFDPVSETPRVAGFSHAISFLPPHPDDLKGLPAGLNSDKGFYPYKTLPTGRSQYLSGA